MGTSLQSVGCRTTTTGSACPGHTCALGTGAALKQDRAGGGRMPRRAAHRPWAGVGKDPHNWSRHHDSTGPQGTAPREWQPDEQLPMGGGRQRPGLRRGPVLGGRGRQRPRFAFGQSGHLPRRAGQSPQLPGRLCSAGSPHTAPGAAAVGWGLPCTLSLGSLCSSATRSAQGPERKAQPSPLPPAGPQPPHLHVDCAQLPWLQGSQFLDH